MIKHSSAKNKVKSLLIAFCLLSILTLIGITSRADLVYEVTYQDPAGDVLDYNGTWHLVGSVDTHPYIDIKWLKSYEDTSGNVVLRLEVKNSQIIEKSNITKYVFRIVTKVDNSTGYNVTYKNGTTTITNFNNTIEYDLTAETSIIDDSGEVLLVNISKIDYLGNIPYFNIDAYTWKEAGNHTYIDYVSEVPGHPGETGNIVDTTGNSSDILWPLIAIVLIIIVLIIVVVVLKDKNKF